jgi:hypothetical protein
LFFVVLRINVCSNISTASVAVMVLKPAPGQQRSQYLIACFKKSLSLGKREWSKNGNASNQTFFSIFTPNFSKFFGQFDKVNSDLYENPWAVDEDQVRTADDTKVSRYFWKASSLRDQPWVKPMAAP